MKNIAFIGMPGAGKTHVASLVASALSRDFYDSDAAIADAVCMSIPEIFKRYGEAYFRTLETQQIHSLLQKKDIILSVGGGAILRNTPLLREHATVIYLKRSISSIMKTLDCSNRPLLSQKDSLETLYTQRKALYEEAAHIVVENEGTPEACVHAILEAII